MDRAVKSSITPILRRNSKNTFYIYLHRQGPLLLYCLARPNSTQRFRHKVYANINTRSGTQGFPGYGHTHKHTRAHSHTRAHRRAARQPSGFARMTKRRQNFQLPCFVTDQTQVFLGHQLSVSPQGNVLTVSSHFKSYFHRQNPKWRSRFSLKPKSAER